MELQIIWPKLNLIVHLVDHLYKVMLSIFIVIFIIYVVGYSYSSCWVWLLLAKTLENKLNSCCYLREMRCLRNKIHSNLFLTFILTNSCWIITSVMQNSVHNSNSSLEVKHLDEILSFTFHFSFKDVRFSSKILY